MWILISKFSEELLNCFGKLFKKKKKKKKLGGYAWLSMCLFIRWLVCQRACIPYALVFGSTHKAGSTQLLSFLTACVLGLSFLFCPSYKFSAVVLSAS